MFELASTSRVELTAENSEVLSVRRASAADCGSEELDCVSGVASEPLKLALELEPGRYAVILDREEPSSATTPDYIVELLLNPPL